MNAIGDGAGRDAADQDINPGVQHRRKWKQRQPQHQRQNVGKLPAIARGREQECQRRQQQDRRGEQLREFGGETVADRGGNEAERDQTAAQPVREDGAPRAAPVAAGESIRPIT